LEQKNKKTLNKFEYLYYNKLYIKNKNILIRNVFLVKRKIFHSEKQISI